MAFRESGRHKCGTTAGPLQPPERRPARASVQILIAHNANDKGARVPPYLACWPMRALFILFLELNAGEALALRSEHDLVLDGRLGVRRHDLARHEVIPVLEWALGASVHDCLGAGRAD